ncbi:hypothetical protein NW762_009976 [Fusarium torreyae]|uniref:Uncharacterized protein n=1 Tax=Fusarium torreyae TaxID=1237075 RepID=A0A9W8RV92_9HYPO|nr:hypothetical protein NW762_009976 [Fusarium torreyae]
MSAQAEAEGEAVSANITFVEPDHTGGTVTLSRVLRLGDVRSDFPRAQDSVDTWEHEGVYYLRARHSASDGFAHGGRVLSHIRQIAGAIREEFRMTLSQVVAERQLARFYGNHAFECMKAAHSKWEIIEVTHPLFAPMNNYPLIICEPSTLDESRDVVMQDPTAPGLPAQTALLKHDDQQCWMFLSIQQPSELLVRKIAASDGTTDKSVPMISSNITSDPARVPEDRIAIRYVVWYL